MVFILSSFIVCKKSVNRTDGLRQVELIQEMLVFTTTFNNLFRCVCTCNCVCFTNSFHWLVERNLFNKFATYNLSNCSNESDNLLKVPFFSPTYRHKNAFVICDMVQKSVIIQAIFRISFLICFLHSSASAIVFDSFYTST